MPGRLPRLFVLPGGGGLKPCFQRPNIYPVTPRRFLLFFVLPPSFLPSFPDSLPFLRPLSLMPFVLPFLSGMCLLHSSSREEKEGLCVCGGVVK